MFTTDKQIREWKDIPKTRKRCGKRLYIRIFGNGSKIFELRIKQEWITIGQYPNLSLSEALYIAAVSSQLLKSNSITIDTLRSLLSKTASAEHLKNFVKEKLPQLFSPLEVVTFDQAFRDWYAGQLRANTWRHKSSARFPLNAYQTYVEKQLGNLSIDKVNRPVIIKCMQPLFISNGETARKLLGYIDKVLETALDKELISGNPCPKKKNFVVPKRQVQQPASLDYRRLPEIWEWLLEAPYSNPVKVAMQLAVITAQRPGLIVNMRWEDIDCYTGLWTISDVPLDVSEGLIKSSKRISLKLPSGLLKALSALPRKCDYVFTVNGKSPINSETLRQNFQKFDKITTYGFKNTFKTWALNQAPPIEAFLADRYCNYKHTDLKKNNISNDLLNKRAELAERYFDYCKGFEWFVRRKRI